MTSIAIRWIAAPSLLLGVLAGCGAEDPDVSLDDEEDVGTAEEALSRPIMRMPFRCGQVWSGQTRSNHSPWQAVDFNRGNDFGDAVVASAAGTVTRVDNEGNTSYGRWIEIGHGNGWRTRYAHLSVQLVKEGQHVTMGQKIGEVGSSGGSTGPHLHYEQLHDGSPVKIILGQRAVHYFTTETFESHNDC